MLQIKPQVKESKLGSSLQARLKVGRPGDRYEQEADRVADRVMRMGEGENMRMQPMEEEEEELQAKLRMQPIEEEEEMLQPKIRMQVEDEEEEELMQPKAKSGEVFASSEVTKQISSTKGNGRPLSSSTNQFMSNALGADLSGVKVHTDSKATQMNQQLGAKAFTHGNDVYFNEGEYNPNSSGGKNLLAHELTHVVQQGNSYISTMIQKSTAAESLGRIEDAASGWGTDEEGIFNAIRECAELSTLRSNPRVTEILNDELSGYDLFKAKLLIKYGSESNFPPGILSIWEATSGAGTNEELVFDAIRSSAQRTRLKNSTWVRRTLRNEMSGHDYAKTQLLFNYGSESSYPRYISPLWRATEGAGTDEDLLFNTLIALSSSDITELSDRSAFVQVIRDELSGSDLQRFNTILSGEGPAIQSDDDASADYGTTQTGSVAVRGEGDTHAFSPDDVTQGFVGDCYFLASLAATANTNPNLLRNMIAPQADDGSYNVTLYVRVGDRYRPQVVNVFPRFPQNNSGTGRETYAYGGDSDTAGNTELWVRLIEKAFAKLRGSYGEIDGGFSSDAMEAITGQEAETIHVPFIDNDDLVTRIRAAFSANKPVTAATYGSFAFADNEMTRSNEIVSGHAYTVMSVTDTTITLRNPHGEGIGNTAIRTLPWNLFRRYFWRVTTIRIAVS